ncbi:MAG: TIGR01459 family HAD-type hydrolase [Methylobacterium sp.]|nr:TIGR01459 family HAD-type hydrolase [Methylobacterium sp.]
MIDTPEPHPRAAPGDPAAADSRRPVWIPGLSALADCYDTFLIDQWGVLHDGRQPYPGVPDTLRQLQARGKTVVILSNSGKRSMQNIRRLAALGIPENAYSRLVTSGEVAYAMLRNHAAVLRGFAGTRCFEVSPDADDHFLDGLHVTPVAALESADFILLRGLPLTPDEGFLERLIARGVATGKPMICANPDHVRITPAGIVPSAGHLANRYEAAGGRVLRIGKPYPEIYRHALAAAGNTALSRVLAIGDSLHHDVAGAHAAGIDALLVLSGVLNQPLEGSGSCDQKLAAVSALAAAPSEIPDWVAEALTW